jgi:Ger(x)C family germination protein
MLVLAAFALNGCWGSMELNQLSIVMGIGVDAAEGGGYEVTAQVVRPGLLKQSSGGGSGSDGKAYFNAKKTAPSVFSAIRNIMDMFSRRMYTQQCKVLVVGEAVAREDMTPVLEYFMRNEEGRMTMPIMIAKGSAFRIFEEGTYLETMPAIQLSNMAENQKYTGLTSYMTVFDFLQDLLSEAVEPTAPIVELFTDEQGEVKARIGETAVFKGERMVGSFSADEVYGMLLINNKLSTGVMHITGLGGLIELEIIRANTSVRPIYDDDGFRIKLQVRMECALVSTTSDSNINEVKEEELIGRLAGAELENRIKYALSAAKVLCADVFSFGQMCYQSFPNEYRELPGGWELEFENLRIDMDINVAITATGAAQHPIKSSQENKDERAD